MNHAMMAEKIKHGLTNSGAVIYNDGNVSIVL